MYFENIKFIYIFALVLGSYRIKELLEPIIIYFMANKNKINLKYISNITFYIALRQYRNKSSCHVPATSRIYDVCSLFTSISVYVISTFFY